MRSNLLQTKKYYDDLLRTIHILLQERVAYEFRTTMIKKYHTKERFLAMLQMIQGAKNYFLQNYRPQKTLDPTFDGLSFSTDEIEGYRALALDYVEQCDLRGYA